MKAEQVMRKMGALPMHVCDAIEWFCFGNTVFDPINIEKWLRHRRQSRNKIARICKVHRNTLARFIRDNEIPIGGRGRA